MPSFTRQDSQSPSAISRILSSSYGDGRLVGHKRDASGTGHLVIDKSSPKGLPGRDAYPIADPVLKTKVGNLMDYT